MDLDVILGDLCECKVSSTDRPDGSVVLAIKTGSGYKCKRVIDHSLSMEEIVRLIKLDLISENAVVASSEIIQPHSKEALPTYSNKPLLRTRAAQLWEDRALHKTN